MREASVLALIQFIPLERSLFLLFTCHIFPETLLISIHTIITSFLFLYVVNLFKFFHLQAEEICVLIELIRLLCLMLF